jgi:predicted dienelactone hydrolase
VREPEQRDFPDAATLLSGKASTVPHWRSGPTVPTFGRSAPPSLRMGAAGLLILLATPALARMPVGVTTLPFAKTSVTTGEVRELPTVVWYPAKGRTGTPEALGRRDATVRRGHWPLLVFSHGACGANVESSYLAMALASRGIVVAAPPHPGHTRDDFPGCLFTTAFADSLANRPADIRFTIDAMLAANDDASSRFAGRLDPDAIGISGLSAGGFTTLVVGQQDPRPRAALVLVPGGAGVLVGDPLTIPTMVIGSERDTVVGFAASQTVYDNVAAPRFLVELLGGNHLSVVDDCFNDTLGIDQCVPGDISQEAAHALVLRYAEPFIRRYLAGKRVATRKLTRQEPGVALEAMP